MIDTSLSRLPYSKNNVKIEKYVNRFNYCNYPQTNMDTLVQISSKYGHALDAYTGHIVKVDFFGAFDIYVEADEADEAKEADKAKDYFDTVKILQNPMGEKAVFIGKNNTDAIYIHELDEDEGGIGCGIWLSSVVLSAWIAHHKHLFKDKTIMELGCGVGLCGLTTAITTTPKSLQLTDCDTSLFECLKTNIERNSKSMKLIPTIQPYDWNTNDTTQQYDIVLASDCVYHNTTCILLDAIINNLKVDGKLIMANPPDWNRPGFDEFIYALQQYGNVSIERMRLVMNKQYSKSIWMIVFTRLGDE